ncbi:MAG: CDP-alcohol phosphatidyltransferase family protein [Lacisediminihabitans sp.]
MEAEVRNEISSKVVTIPNVLSLIRLGLVPVFLVLVIVGNDGLALLTLVVSSVTDYLDGLLARKLNQVTRLGQLLDPAADRLFIFATLIGLSIREIVPWWFVAIIVGRDVTLLVLGVVMANVGYGPLPVHHMGKIATFCLFYALPILMIGQVFPGVVWLTSPFGWAFAAWGAFLYWWAGVIYLVQSSRIITVSRTAEVHRSDTLED